MAATNGTMIFVGARSRKTYVVDVYLSDTVNTAINWDDGGGASATTPTEWIPPEPVLLIDWSVVTGAAQTKLQITRANRPTGDHLRHTLHLNTLAFRPRLTIGFPAGQPIRAIQRA
jgi:hypothetical protein